MKAVESRDSLREAGIVLHVLMNMHKFLNISFWVEVEHELAHFLDEDNFEKRKREERGVKY